MCVSQNTLNINGGFKIIYLTLEAYHVYITIFHITDF